MTTPTVGCRVPGCTTEPYRGRLCGPHRYRWRQYGEFEGGPWRTADETDIAVAVERRRMHDGATRLERKRIGLLLTDRGLSLSEIARITHVSPRTVGRWRADRRATA